MRVFVAILQLLLISLPMFASATTAMVDKHGDGNLPACCRRAGAHHCMMSSAALETLENGVHAAAQPHHCPLYPKALITATHMNAASGNLPELFSLAAQPMRIAQVEARRRIAQDRARHKRGPPALA